MKGIYVSLIIEPRMNKYQEINLKVNEKDR